MGVANGPWGAGIRAMSAYAGVSGVDEDLAAGAIMHPEISVSNDEFGKVVTGPTRPWRKTAVGAGRRVERIEFAASKAWEPGANSSSFPVRGG